MVKYTVSKAQKALGLDGKCVSVLILPKLVTHSLILRSHLTFH